MATKEQIEIAVKLINEVAGSPDSGAIAELVKEIQKSEIKSFDKVAATEVRIVESKETR
jgi:hypothetical protein